MRRDCHVCRSEGFNALSRLRLTTSRKSIIATLNVVDDRHLLEEGEVGLSGVAWDLLRATEGESVTLSHPKPLTSLSHVRAKIYGHTLDEKAMYAIVDDIAAGRYSDVHLAAFITACVDKRLNPEEVTQLTKAMTEVGDRLHWGREVVIDKHCVGGLPGNRTTPIVVAIATACGLTMPKTSSRAITSPAGTADTMETLAPVALGLEQMKQVVEQEGGCIVWGGSVNLSPADDTLIRVERALDLDSEGQLVASVLSKKLAAGSTHVLVDMPVGPTAKIRDEEMALRVGAQLKGVGQALGMTVDTQFSDGTQPVGFGIGPALEAEDVLAVLNNDPAAPGDLQARALQLSASLLELGGAAEPGNGLALAEQTLLSGVAFKKFQAICEAQGGMREPPKAHYQHEVVAKRSGLITHINNRVLARIAKFAGAPAAKSAGIKLLARLGATVTAGDLLFTIYAESPGELQYALDFFEEHGGPVMIEDEVM